MSDLNAGKNSMGKMLFGILSVFMLALLGAGAYLAARSNWVVSSEKAVLPATGKNMDPKPAANIPPSADNPPGSIFHFGGGYTLVINPDGSGHMITPDMTGNPERSTLAKRAADGGSYALVFRGNGRAMVGPSAAPLNSQQAKEWMVRKITIGAGYALITRLNSRSTDARAPTYPPAYSLLNRIDLGEGHTLVINPDGTGRIVAWSYIEVNGAPSAQTYGSWGDYLITFFDASGKAIPISALVQIGNEVKK